MNAISKKLLSMLVVLAMVLTMVPFGGLSVFAVETNATEVAASEVTPGQANLPEGVQAIIDEASKVVNTDEAIDAHIAAGTCPMCGATGITWETWTAGVANKADTSDESWHFYLDESVTRSGNVFGVYANSGKTSANNTYCAAIKSNVVISNTGTRFVMLSGTNNVINIMGTGKAITNVGTTRDFGMFQIGSGTLNLYGGTYILEDIAGGTDSNGKSTDGVYAAIRAVGGDVNIFNDAIIGPETVDTAVTTYNVSISNANSEVKMYGGTIRNGVTAKNGFSGNVTIANSGKFYMYGGTIENGQYNTSVNPASVGGNIVVGGVPEGQTAATPGSFYMYGGTVTGGKANNGGNGGGNINTYNADNKGVMELMGGIIKDGWAKAAGGNVQIQGGTNHKIGGTVLITNGSGVSGGNVHIQTSRKLTMEGGFIQGGALATSNKNATNGGGVYVAGTFDMTGGEIDGCTVSNNGGSIYAAGGATVNVGANAVIKNGLSKNATNGGGGGNVYLVASATAGSTMTTSGTIIGGTVNGGSSMLSSGGNISVVANGSVQSVLTVNGGTIANGSLAYGTAGSSFGGNIRAYNCKVVINDGLIYGGTTGTAKSNSNIGVQGGTSSSANTNCTLEVNGGVIVGDMIAGTYNTPSGTKTGDYTYTCDLKISGDAKIVNSYKLDDGSTVRATYGALSYYAATPYDFSGLTEGAQIVMTGSKGGVFSTAMDASVAESVKGYFSCSNSALAVDANDDGALYIIDAPVNDPVVGVFEPWACGGMAYCPACGDTAPVAWKTLDSSHAASYIDGHYYLAGDITNASKGSQSAYILPTYGKICCLNLNGHDLTVTDGPALFGANGTLNMIDTAEEQGTVSGGGTSSAGATLMLNGGKGSSKVNIYGGIYTKIADNSAAPIISINANGGTLTMYGGTIDGTGKTTTNVATCVYLQGSVGGQYSAQAIFNMYGGTILGGTTTGNGGAVHVGSFSADTATTSYCNAAVFNLYGGEIIGGTANSSSGGGGCIFVVGNTFNMYGGTVKDGTAAAHGGNINITNKATKNSDGSAGTPAPGIMNMSAGTISGGTAATQGSSNGGSLLINTDCVLNMTGGTIYGGTAGNQGGVLRAYKADVNMSGNAKIYAGTAQGNTKTHGIWLVSSDMTMTDNAIVYGKGTDSPNAISVAPYGAEKQNNTVISTLTLSGNATVKNETGESKNSISVGWTLANNADAADDDCGKLIITDGWTGEAYVTLTKNTGVAEGATSSSLVGYKRGETIDNAVVECGSFSGKLYYGPQSNTQLLGVDGNLIVGLAAIKAADGESWYATNEEALDAYYANGGFEAGSYVLLGDDSEITLAGDTYVDSRGYVVTVDGVGTLYAMDNANDDYYGFGIWTIISEDVEVATDVENAVKDRRYIVIDMTKDDEGNRRVTAHRLEMGLSAVSLRTTQAGLYYKATYSCDSTLAGRISAYGVVLSVNDMPGADFLDVPTDGFSCYESGFEVNKDNNYTVSATSGAVFGIFKDEEAGRDADTNAEYGRMKIYANTYIMVNAQGDSDASNDIALVGDNANAGTKGGNAYSLFDILKSIDSNWAEYADVQAQITEFYNTWAELGMNQYAGEFENIA